MKLILKFILWAGITLGWFIVFPFVAYALVYESNQDAPFRYSPSRDIFLMAPKSELLVGETIQLSVDSILYDGTLTNVSDDPKLRYQITNLERGYIAISSAGEVTAQKRGSAFILAIYSDLTLNSYSSFLEIHVRLPGDTDDDGMTDAFETLHGLNPNDPADGELDADGDLLSNREEYEQGTNPNSRDTDGDTFIDSVELALEMDPNSPDARLKIPSSLLLNEKCIVTALNRSVQVNPDGTFGFANLPVVDGAFRVRAVCDNQGQILNGQSDFMVGIPNGVVPVTRIQFYLDEPSPVSLEVTAPLSVLNLVNNATQLTTTGSPL